MVSSKTIEEFRNSVTLDLYSPDEFIDWKKIEKQLIELRPAIDALESAVATRSQKRFIEAIRQEPKVLQAIRALLAVRGSVGFADGRELPAHPPESPTEWRALAAILQELRLWRILSPSSSVSDLLRVALVASDADSRRFRVRHKLEREVDRLLRKALTAAQSKLQTSLSILPPSGYPDAVKGKVDHVIAADDTPIAAIATVFQATSGGRQQRDLSLTYPSLQRSLDEIPLALMLVLDGRGVKQTPDAVLMSLLDGVASCMTLKQARQGGLARALAQFGSSRGRRRIPTDPLTRIIEGLLSTRGSVNANELPTNLDDARLALAQYVEEHAEKGLLLSPGGTAIGWSRPRLIRRLQNLADSFDPTDAVRTFARLLKDSSLGMAMLEADGQSQAAVIRLKPDSVLPSELLVVGHSDPVSQELSRDVARRALQGMPDARLAVIVTAHAPTPEEYNALRKTQSMLPCNVVVLDPARLLRIAESQMTPRDSFVGAVLEQSDLIKASPYVLSSVTPDRMYFGREGEEATLLSTLATNSVALLGARRIGKTSLLRHVKSRLEQADFAPFLVDCQTVRDWNDFGDLARREWKVRLRADFKPRLLLDLVSQLKNRLPGKPVVIMLDEIDQLLDWDQKHSDDEVPEAFFKACRTISQQGLAQFVFSGERVIAQKLWDPASPHWNFCRPLPLHQLNREAAEQLLMNPLRSLGIRVSREDEFGNYAWRRTSGHPQLLQFIGDKLVRLINERAPAKRGEVGPEDLSSVAESFDYGEHYLSTYWGQSTDLEKLVSLYIADGVESPPKIVRRIQTAGVTTNESEILQALRMLDLYGVVTLEDSGYALRIDWFDGALHYYGNATQVRDSLLGRLL